MKTTIHSNARVQKIFIGVLLFFSLLIFCRKQQDSTQSGLSQLPKPPTNLRISAGVSSAELRWTDNSSNEKGFIIRRNMPNDTTTFVDVGMVPADITQFNVAPLQYNTVYVFRVTAFGQSGGESSPAEGKVRTLPPPIVALLRPTDLTATAISNQSILLSWKDNISNEDGFIIERKRPDETSWKTVNANVPANARSYLNNDLLPNTIYEYRVKAKINGEPRLPSNEAKATTNAVVATVRHSKGLIVDNQGGGAEGCSHFSILGFDQLYDGHLQIWAGGTKVCDGDDRDFKDVTPIILNDPSTGTADEHTSAAAGPANPVVFRCEDEKVEVKQFTYQKDNQNWILAKWTVHNLAPQTRNIKLALFLDADAGGTLSANDVGGFDPARKLVYLKNLASGIHVGMAVIAGASFYESFQVSHFLQAVTPDNSNINRDGETARKWLFSGLNTGMLHGRNSSEASDLTMTLVSNLGAIASQDNRQVIYAIAVGPNLTDLQSTIDNAISFAPGLRP